MAEAEDVAPWVLESRRLRDQLAEAYGIRRKEYHQLVYSPLTGELELYQETEDSPVMVKKDGVWVEWVERAPRTAKGRKRRKQVTDSLREMVLKQLDDGIKPADVARNLDLSASAVSRISKERENA